MKLPVRPLLSALFLATGFTYQYQSVQLIELLQNTICRVSELCIRKDEVEDVVVERKYDLALFTATVVQT